MKDMRQELVAYEQQLFGVRTLDPASFSHSAARGDVTSDVNGDEDERQGDS